MEETDIITDNNNNSLFDRVALLIEQSRTRVASAINTAMVHTYYEIGRYIIEDEQFGKKRAEYGKTVLKGLSIKLTDKFGDGWSVENLKLFRRFYMIYSDLVNTDYPIQKIGIANNLQNANLFIGNG